MTSDPGKHQADEKLERDLEAIRTALSGGDDPQPPDLLNQAVLNAARRELAGRNKRWLRRFPVRWMGAFATASVVVLALGLIVQQEQESAVITGSEADRARLRSEATLEESKTVKQEPLMSKSTDRDDPAVRSTAPMAAAPARTAEFAVEKAADEPALPEREDASEEVRTPEEWIALMLELKASNQLTRLSEELEEFRSVYPDYPLPAGLRD